MFAQLSQYEFAMITHTFCRKKVPSNKRPNKVGWFDGNSDALLTKICNFHIALIFIIVHFNYKPLGPMMCTPCATVIVYAMSIINPKMPAVQNRTRSLFWIETLALTGAMMARRGNPKRSVKIKAEAEEIMMRMPNMRRGFRSANVKGKHPMTVVRLLLIILNPIRLTARTQLACRISAEAEIGKLSKLLLVIVGELFCSLFHKIKNSWKFHLVKKSPRNILFLPNQIYFKQYCARYFMKKIDIVIICHPYFIWKENYLFNTQFFFTRKLLFAW